MKTKKQQKLIQFIVLIGVISLIEACSPTVKVQAPDKPIEINLNIKIEQEVRIKIEKDLDDMFKEDPDLFGMEEG